MKHVVLIAGQLASGRSAVPTACFYDVCEGKDYADVCVLQDWCETRDDDEGGWCFTDTCGTDTR